MQFRVRLFIFAVLIQLIMGFFKAESASKQKHSGLTFSNFWSTSIEYRETNMVYKFTWRRLNDKEIHPENGIIRVNAVTNLCTADINLRDPDFSSWRLLQLEDLQGYAFQKLLRDYPDFGSYRLDGRLTLKHKLVMQSLKTYPPRLLDQLFVVLTIGTDRRNFQLDVYPHSRVIPRAQPTDVLCIANKTVASSTLPPVATTDTVRPTSQIVHATGHTSVTPNSRIWLPDCLVNTSSKRVTADVLGSYLTPMDAFLISHRSTFFVLTICCTSLLMLLICLLLCLVQRYRALGRRHQQLLLGVKGKGASNRNGRSPSSPGTQDSNSVYNSSYSASTPLWPKSVSSTPLTAEPRGNGTVKSVSCDSENASAGTPVGHRHRCQEPPEKTIQLHQQQHQFVDDLNKIKTPPSSTVKCNSRVMIMPSSDTDLGIIAARRFRDTLRRKGTGGQYASINGGGVIYSSLHQHRTEVNISPKEKSSYVDHREADFELSRDF